MRLRRLANVVTAVAICFFLVTSGLIVTRMGDQQKELELHQQSLGGMVRSNGDAITFAGQTLRQIRAEQLAQTNALLKLIFDALNQERAKLGLPPLVIPQAS